MKNQSLGSDNSMILPVWATSKQNPDKKILVYCILDDQSNTCFISSKLRSQMKLTGHDTILSLSTMDRNQSYVACKKVVDLEIISFDRKTCIPLSLQLQGVTYLLADVKVQSRKLPGNGTI